MTNTGSDNPETVNETDSSPPLRSVPLKIIVLGLIAVVLAVVIGSQVIGVLYAIFFPPAVPVPESVTLVSHSSSDYGTDDWLYNSSQSACDVLHFYQSQGALCRVAPVACESADTSQSLSIETGQGGQNVARCVGTQHFSIFALRWEVIVATGVSDKRTSQFRLNREIYWTGAIPPSSGPTLDGGFSDFVSPSLEPTNTN